MPTPLSTFIADNPEYTVAFIARQMQRDKGHISRIATGVISPRPETRLALEIATGGGVPADAWAEPGPRIRRDLPSYSFRFVKEGDPVLYCALDSEGRACWQGSCSVEKVDARGFSLCEVSGVFFSKINGWADNGAAVWLVPLAAPEGEALLLDGLNGAPRAATGTESSNPKTGLRVEAGECSAKTPPARLVPANWVHTPAYLRNRRFPFNV